MRENGKICDVDWCMGSLQGAGGILVYNPEKNAECFCSLYCSYILTVF